MDKTLLNRVGKAIHEAMRHQLPGIPPCPWDAIGYDRQASYRAVAHSALVAIGHQYIWVVTDESDREDRTETSVIGLYQTREDALAELPKSYGGAEDIDWQPRGDDHYYGMYGEYPWVMARLPINEP